MMIRNGQQEGDASGGDVFSELENPLMLVGHSLPRSGESSEGSSLGGSPYAARSATSLDSQYAAPSLRIRTPSLTGLSAFPSSGLDAADPATTPVKTLKHSSVTPWGSYSGTHRSIILVACCLLLVSCMSIGFSAMGIRPDWLGRRKTLPRDSLASVVAESGSMFGFLHFKMDCPTAHVGADDDDADEHAAYLPKALFPVSSTVPSGTSALSPHDHSELTLLVGVLSSCKAAKDRQAVRDTWMRLLVPVGATWRAVFLLTKSCEDQLQNESRQFGDLLFLDAEESYYALTPKVTEFFKYANEIGARYTMKTDDDTFVFIDRLLSELQRMDHNSCLYWGGPEKLPDMKHYNGSGIDVPLNKWYIDKKDYETLADTRYMAGGGYILSQDLVHKMVENMNHLHLADRLPEDASMGRLLGDDVYSQCHCADSRHAKHITNFQGIELFHEDIFECEREDVARRVITMHGFKNATQMGMMLRYATHDYELECNITERDFQNVGTMKHWGRAIDNKAWAKDSIMSTWRLAEALSHPVDPHLVLKRKMFVSFRNSWGRRLTTKAEKKERDNMLNAIQKNLVPLSDILDAEADGKLDIPWCTRLTWATQMIGMAAEMVDLKMLICDLNLSHYFVDAETLLLNTHHGSIQLSYSDTRFHSNSVCFSDVQCQACYPTSVSWLPNNKCDTSRGKCMGFDGYTQTHVIVRDFLLPSILPNGWMGSAQPDHGAIGRRLEAEIQNVADLTDVDLSDIREPANASPALWKHYETLFTLMQEPEVVQCAAETTAGTSAGLQMLRPRFSGRK